MIGLCDDGRVYAEGKEVLAVDAWRERWWRAVEGDKGFFKNSHGYWKPGQMEKHKTDGSLQMYGRFPRDESLVRPPPRQHPQSAHTRLARCCAPSAM